MNDAAAIVDRDNKAENDDDTVFDDDLLSGSSASSPYVSKRRCKSVIDSKGEDDGTFVFPGHRTPRRSRSDFTEQISPDQGFSATPDPAESQRPEWMTRRTDIVDAHVQQVANDEEFANSFQPLVAASMPVYKDIECYNMKHKNRGKCLVFNHETFDNDLENRDGSTTDAKRIERTFKNLGFTVDILDNLTHSDITAKICELSEEDHTDNDCICIFILTHGLNHDTIWAKDVAYRSDIIWKPFVASKCRTLAGKPKLFFFQACRGDKLDGGVMLFRSSERTQTDSAVASYKIPTHADFLIAHSTVQGFFSWRNPEEGTWYIQCLCDVLDQYSNSMDLLKMLTITARRIATDYESFNDLNPMKHGQKQVPSFTSMLTRDLYFQ